MGPPLFASSPVKKDQKEKPPDTNVGGFSNGIGISWRPHPMPRSWELNRSGSLLRGIVRGLFRVRAGWGQDRLPMRVHSAVARCVQRPCTRKALEIFAIGIAPCLDGSGRAVWAGVEPQHFLVPQVTSGAPCLVGWEQPALHMMANECEGFVNESNAP